MIAKNLYNGADFALPPTFGTISAMNTAEEKAAQRESMRAKRGSIAADVRKNYEAALEDRLLNLPALKHAKCIAVYYPTGSEARFVSNREKLFLFDQRPTIAFPLVRSETNMSFFSFDMSDDWSILETPREIVTNLDPARHVPPENIDLMLVPGIAFDRHGNRLGQGGGFYDRFLPYLSADSMTIGIAFDEQVVDEVPHEATDCRVDYIVTPTRVITAEK